MDIYIKPAEKVQLVGKREVLLRDVAEVFLSGQTAGEAERLVVFRIPEERKKDVSPLCGGFDTGASSKIPQRSGE